VTIWSFLSFFADRGTLSLWFTGVLLEAILFVLDSVLQYRGGESVLHALTETTALTDHFEKSLNGYEKPVHTSHTAP
jgi:hypothetical protein